MTIIAINDLTIKRGGRAVLDALSLSVAAGEIYALLGGNGAGKSTTLSALLGFLKPASGSMTVAGIDPATNAEAARHEIAYLPENVEYFLALAGETHSADDIEAAFDAAGLQPEARNRPLGGYSKGMRQKVAIALAVVRQVPVLLLDEPTSGLDPRATADFNALIGTLKDRGTAILMVTHDLLGAADCADRIGFLDRGRIVEEVGRGVGSSGGYDVMALHRRYGDAVAA
jgi:ABC-2 type transport system ATP-binding protein